VDSFIVDANIWHECMRLSWCRSGDYYQTNSINNKNKQIHHFVLGLKDSALVDHIDHNPKNNKIDNLRISDYSKNGHNSTKIEGTTSSYRGVHFQNPKWIAQINKEKQNYYLGFYETEKAAAIAYNNKAIELYGTYANLNIII